MIDNEDMKPDVDEKPSEQFDADGLLLKLKRWFREDIKAAEKWRKEAKEDYAFYNGDQWADEDMAVLREQRRPVMTFNRVAPLVNAVTGSEINNRREVRYIPREIGDSIANELLTAAGEWFRDQANAEDEDSEAFSDAVICGMGWTDTRLDFENNPDGDPCVQRLDPFKMVWDCGAVKPNLSDAKRLWYVDEKQLDELMGMFPDIDPADFHAGWVNSTDDADQHDQDIANAYASGKDVLAQNKKCTIVECRWFDREVFYRAIDMQTGQPKEYNAQEFEELTAQMPDVPHVKQIRKVVKRVFIGRTLLSEPDKPLVPADLLGWECITGYHDKNKKQFYGVVKPTKDPQRWSNKYFSQVMFLLNSQAKGGIMAERGAFEDDRQAEESWTKADSITWASKGGLSNGAIQPKPAAQFPAGFFTLFNESKEAISQVTGLSPEFIGTREVNQPGVLETQRRQSSLNLLASLFNSLKKYRKRQGRIVLHLIQNYLSDGRLIRIVGDEKAQYVPLTREDVANIEYDIIVDDAPTSPNEKERTFAIIQQMLPLLRDYLTPEIGLELLKYTPLPASMVDKMVEAAKAAQEQQAQQAQQQQEPSPDQMAAQVKMQTLQADVEAKQAKHQMDLEAKGIDLYTKQMQANMDLQVAQTKAELDAQRLAGKEVENQIRQQRANTQRANVNL